MVRGHKQNEPRNRLDPTIWIPRPEACRILQVSRTTILRWKGPRFRVIELREKNTGGKPAWFVNADDVERVRLERLGPTVAETEAFVLSELGRGATAGDIVAAGRRVTLADIERIRDHSARLSGAFVLDAATCRELRQELTIDYLDGPLLLGAVKALLVRVDGLLRDKREAERQANRAAS